MESTTTQQVYAEINLMRATLVRLQSDLERLALAVASEANPPTRWLALAGVGAEMWRQVDGDLYLKQERDSWI